MSAQNETWWEALLGLLGMSPYADDHVGIPDAHGPCVQFEPADRARGYDYDDPRIHDSSCAATDCDY